MLSALLRTYLRPYRRALAVIVVLQLAQTLASLYLPALNADIIDSGVVRGDTGYILRVGGYMLAVSFVQIVCQVGAVFYGARTAMALGRDLRAAVYRQVQSFSAREVGQFGAPSLITRITNDVQQVQMLVAMVLTLALIAPVAIVGSIALALHQDVPLASILLIALPILIGLVALLIRLMRPQFRLMQTHLDEINRVLREQITGIRVIRAFVREPSERARFASANDNLYEVSLRTGRLMSTLFPTVMLVVNLSSVAVLWFGGHRIDAGSLQVGELTAFLTYLMQTLLSVLAATFVFMMLPRAEVGAERLTEVLVTETSVVPPAEPVALPVVRGRLEFRQVSYRFPGADEPVLSGIDLVAHPGEITAIVGSTGSGKTTLLNLIPRLIDVTGGAVLIDGVDVRDLAPGVRAEAIAMVPQKPYLFTGTIATNLRYGDPAATNDDLWHALEIAQAASFVRAMPDGLDAPIAQGGSNVSGGQRQRLAIARALVRKPAIYLFDDSFSALDYATDAALRAALTDKTADATVLVVAHRVSTIRDADRILVLDEGRVVGTGTHTELMDTNATYREIVASQFTEREAAA